jgi:23S rRNA pseudouridine1911/1915/1917 synthase
MRQRFTSRTDGRLDKIISDHTKLSRKRAAKVVESGGVRVNGTRARYSSQTVTQGSVIELGTAAPADPERPIEIRYQDGSILVADKPHGLPSQAGRDGKRKHLYGILCGQHAYVGLHHRLDTPASGLVLFTLDRRANKSIAEGFQKHTIERTYRLVVVGDPGESGSWNTPISGKRAVTHFRRMAIMGGMCLLEATLETGRTHQIRVHAAAAGHPIVGDKRHGGSAGNLWPRLALHACRLALHHPVSGENLTVSSPVPEDLQELWAKLGLQCSPETEAE